MTHHESTSASAEAWVHSLPKTSSDWDTLRTQLVAYGESLARSSTASREELLTQYDDTSVKRDRTGKVTVVKTQGDTQRITLLELSESTLLQRLTLISREEEIGTPPASLPPHTYICFELGEPLTAARVLTTEDTVNVEDIFASVRKGLELLSKNRSTDTPSVTDRIVDEYTVFPDIKLPLMLSHFGIDNPDQV